MLGFVLQSIDFGCFAGSSELDLTVGFDIDIPNWVVAQKVPN